MMKLALVCVLALAAVSLSSLLAQHEVDRILTRVAGFLLDVACSYLCNKI